jgi:hypothetical protein
MFLTIGNSDFLPYALQMGSCVCGGRMAEFAAFKYLAFPILLALWTAAHRAISRLGCVFAFVASGFRVAVRAGRGRGRGLWRAASPFREVVAQV